MNFSDNLLRVYRMRGETAVYKIYYAMICKIIPPLCILWHYRLWSFKTRDTKLERFLHKNQHNQRKLLNFENWTNGEPQ